MGHTPDTIIHFGKLAAEKFEGKSSPQSSYLLEDLMRRYGFGEAHVNDAISPHGWKLEGENLIMITEILPPTGAKKPTIIQTDILPIPHKKEPIKREPDNEY